VHASRRELPDAEPQHRPSKKATTPISAVVRWPGSVVAAKGPRVWVLVVVDHPGAELGLLMLPHVHLPFSAIGVGGKGIVMAPNKMTSVYHHRSSLNCARCPWWWYQVILKITHDALISVDQLSSLIITDHQ
jgi:hypothetical protein